MTLSFPGTFSKSPLSFGLPEDTHIIKAHGCRVTLNDGKEYIDWISGLGSNLLGYGSYNRQWMLYVSNALSLWGGSLSLPHQIEYAVADQLCSLLSSRIPYWNGDPISCRFMKTGSDATTSAVRLARSVTANPTIVCVKGGYHGWHSWTIGRTQPAHGITRNEIQDVIEFKFGDLEDLERVTYGKEIAGVILEQGLDDARFDFYDGLRRFCDNRKCLLIMDEVVTGLRYALGGACELYGIKPDLVCMGKALGNGLPISVLVGREEYMNWFGRIDPVFCSSTFWGESVGLAAAKAVLDQWDENKVDWLWDIGHKLFYGLHQAGWSIIGDPPRSVIKFKSLEEHAFFIHGMMSEGVLMNRPNLPTMAHGEDEVKLTVEASVRVRGKYKTAMERGTLGEVVKGKLPRVLFSNR